MTVERERSRRILPAGNVIYNNLRAWATVVVKLMVVVLVVLAVTAVHGRSGQGSRGRRLALSNTP